MSKSIHRVMITPSVGRWSNYTINNAVTAKMSALPMLVVRVDYKQCCDNTILVFLKDLLNDNKCTRSV